MNLNKKNAAKLGSNDHGQNKWLAIINKIIWFQMVISCKKRKVSKFVFLLLFEWYLIQICLKVNQFFKFIGPILIFSNFVHARFYNF